MFDLWLQARQARGGIKHRNRLWALPIEHTSGQRLGLFYLIRRRRLGGFYVSRARTASVHDEAIIAFLLFCLEIYQAEQKRKRSFTKHGRRAIEAIWLGRPERCVSSSPPATNDLFHGKRRFHIF